MRDKIVAIGLLIFMIGLGLAYFDDLGFFLLAGRIVPSRPFYIAMIVAGLVVTIIGFRLMGEIPYNPEEAESLEQQKQFESKKENAFWEQGKYCRHCGSLNKEDAVFCEKCGKRIS